jgi:NAD(P)-dependent dehydrogenase (short-subunit alcohol dehydrogenase family)
MAQKLRGRTAVVSGASSGVGRAIARRFAREGANVALLARNPDGLEAAAAEVRDCGASASTFCVDVSDANAVEEAARSVARDWGGIDIWVNNAMVTVLSPVREMRPDEYRRVIEVNYLGYVYGTLSALAQMRGRNRGVIVQIGSALAYRSIPLQSAYCASKAAIRGFTDSLRSELVRDRSGIEVTMLQLPAVNTPQVEVARNRMPGHPQPVPPIYQPEVIADAALHAVLHPRREMWIGWRTTQAIVGQRVIPGLLDRYLARRAWESQTTSDLPPGHPARHTRDNLDETIPGDRGAHGPFDAKARTFSSKLWLRTHPAFVAGAAMIAVALVARLDAGRGGSWLSHARRPVAS